MAPEKTDLEAERPGGPTLSSDTELEGVSSSINETALLRKLDLRLLPAVSVLYLLSFLDRSNGGFLMQFAQARMLTESLQLPMLQSKAWQQT